MKRKTCFEKRAFNVEPVFLSLRPYIKEAVDSRPPDNISTGDQIQDDEYHLAAGLTSLRRVYYFYYERGEGEFVLYGDTQ